MNRLLNISPRTAQLILNSLESKGILESIFRGKIKSYFLRKNSTSKNYLILAESYKTTLFMDKNPLVGEIIEKILPLISGIGLIFGSYAKGTQNKESDLDIFVIGYIENNKIREISKTYQIEINLVVYPLEKYKSVINKDILVKEVLENHIAIKNIDGFVLTVMGNE
ncbi:MAG TPA: nucleotidyltransferase domain-containing protein [Methanofastidiosum sp.]|nr:nucleotidyltransferase domain-containing protein [Methanofastidiosum sp.]